MLLVAKAWKKTKVNLGELQVSIPSTRGFGKVKWFHKLRGANPGRPDQEAIRNITPITKNKLSGMNLFHHTLHESNTALIQSFKGKIKWNMYETYSVTKGNPNYLG